MRYKCAGPTAGEVAFVVQARWQGHGIATALLHRLVDYARGSLVELVAHMLGWNTQRRSLLRHCGFPAVSFAVDGMTAVRLDIPHPPAPAGAR